MRLGETTIVTDDSLNTVKGQYDLLFFNATYENSSVFELLRKHCDQVWTYEHNIPTAQYYDEIYHRYKEADNVFVPSKYLRDQILSKQLGKVSDKIHILPIPIDISCFDFELKQQDDYIFSFVTICAIKEIRNLTFNIDIIKCLKDKGVHCTYDIYGMIPYMSDSTYYHKIKRYINELKLNDVVKVHHELVGAKCISNTLQKYNFYIDFALDETYGQAKIEALASGLTLVMPSTGNNSAIIPPGCMLFDGSAEENAEKLWSSFGESNNFIDRRSVYRKHVELNYSDDAVSKMLRGLL